MLERSCFFGGAGIFVFQSFPSMFRYSIALGLRCHKTLCHEEYIDEAVHVSQGEVEKRGQDKGFAHKDILPVSYFP